SPGLPPTLPMNRTPSSRPSPPVGEKVPEGRLRGIPTGSRPQLTSNFLEVFALHEPPPHPFPLPIRWGEGGREVGEGWFMVPMRAEKRMGALHEPPPHPFPLPLRGGRGWPEAG